MTVAPPYLDDLMIDDTRSKLVDWHGGRSRRNQSQPDSNYDRCEKVVRRLHLSAPFHPSARQPAKKGATVVSTIAPAFFRRRSKL